MDAERLIKEIRALDKPHGTLIGGAAADFTDSQSGIAKNFAAGTWLDRILGNDLDLYLYRFNYLAD